MIQNWAFIIGGLILLVLGGNWLLKSAVATAHRFEIPKVIIGMTVVSMATSFPELVVSLNAALQGSSMIALGNVVGSNISNIGFILSITAIFTTIIISKKFFTFDYPVLIASSLVLVLMMLDGDISRWDGMILLMSFVAFIYFLIQRTKKNKEIEEETEALEPLAIWKVIIYFILGVVGLWIGAELMVKGAVALAENIGLSERIIGVTIVAIGTSIPELTASLISILKKENDISLGNIVGSNIFNILLILGTVTTISPIEISDDKALYDAIIMLGFACLLWPLALIPIRYTISWRKGLVILALFILFIYQTIS